MPVAAYSMEDRSWSELAVTGESPGPRRGHTALYDAAGDRVVLFGGTDNRAYRSDCWQLSLDGMPRWSRLGTTGDPAPRAAHVAVLDSAGRRMLVMGGADAVRRMNDVWALDLEGPAAWSRLTVGGAAPTARHSHSAVFDAKTRSVLVFGGYDMVLKNDAWVLQLEPAPRWRPLLPNGEVPEPRKDHLAVLDPGGRMIVIGGDQASGSLDAWALIPGEEPRWSRIAAGDSLQPPRRSAAGAFVPQWNAVAVHGGWKVNSRRELWTLRLDAPERWAIEPPARLPPDHGEVYSLHDPVRQRPIFLFANAGTFPDVYEPWTVSDDLNDWTSLMAPIPPRVFRHSSSIVFDPVHDRLVSTFGSYVDGSGWRTTNLVWTLPMDRPSGWTEVTPEGTAPPGRSHAATVYDPVGRRMLLFGGWDYDAPNYPGDLWALSLRDTLRWQLLRPVGPAPPPMSGGEAAYDPVGHRMLVFGGSTPSGLGGVLMLDSVWSLSLGDTLRWEELAIEGPRPRARWGHRVVWDSARNRLILHGGRYDWGIGVLPEVWALEFNDRPRWRQLKIEGRDRGVDRAGLAYDARNDRLVVVAEGTVYRALNFAPHPPPAPPASVSLLSLIGPNPARGSVDLRVDLASAGEIVVDVFDVGGRRVRRVVGQSLGAGAHTLSWNGLDGTGHPVSAGLYFVQARASHQSQTRRVILLR
jgi:hypothetical protein